MIAIAYLTICPVTNKVHCYKSIEKATESSIRRNKKHEDHPAYRLYLLDADGDTKYVGRLWRAFGQDFDPKDCWRKPMTAIERAAAITRKLHFQYGLSMDHALDVEILLNLQFKAHSSEEREACARIADEAEQQNLSGTGDNSAPEHIATAIRARG